MLAYNRGGTFRVAAADRPSTPWSAAAKETWRIAAAALEVPQVADLRSVDVPVATGETFSAQPGGAREGKALASGGGTDSHAFLRHLRTQGRAAVLEGLGLGGGSPGQGPSA